MGLAHNVAKQLSRPTGFWGKLIGFGMKRGNRSLNEWTIEQLNLDSSAVTDISYYQQKKGFLKTCDTINLRPPTPGWQAVMFY